MGKFIVTLTKDCKTFVLKAANGAKIARPKTIYDNKARLLDAIERIRNIATSANIEDQTLPHCLDLAYPKYEILRFGDSGYYYQLRARNGDILLTSSVVHRQKASCFKGIESVRTNAPTAEVVIE